MNSLMSRHISSFSKCLIVVALTVLGATTASAAIPVVERNALIALFNSAGGTGWVDNTNWCSNGACPTSGSVSFNAPGTECAWYGVECDASNDGHVFRIDLGDNNLVGSLPPLDSLTNLTHFSVNGNQLVGQIPAINGLMNLIVFDVSSNRLDGPIPTLAGLTNLGLLDIDSNQLTGAIPTLTGLTNLEYFYASSNRLDGPIPTLTGLTNLKLFHVGSNQLTGSIPALTGLTNLETFFADHNSLNGPIPALTGLTNLIYLALNNNQLTGAVPATPGPSMIATICPNPLDIGPSANGAAWNLATGFKPWWATPFANNACDDLFHDPFGT